ncbi:MAG: chromosomal replication initiator protein DnaA [bacterium]|nr:MAG: chromosomal replication initiator protein DnaA [bacterium]
MPASKLWKEILTNLQGEVNPQIFSTWFDPLVPVDIEGGRLVLEAPHAFIRDWIEENYATTLNRIVQSLTGKDLSVLILVSEGGAPEPPPARKRPKKPAREASPPKQEVGGFGNGGLNPKYTFDSFVVGSSNQFAHAAAMAVSEHPARSYNPLFVYGGVGLGKTHLMHAIGHMALSRDPSLRLCYLSSERFMNELINSLRFDRMPQFREMYRTMDILLVDDIQFIAGKERTQEEFFHTFNTLFDSHKQIVVSSDKYPREIPDLEERLRSRFEWGLVADIQPPDLETKIAILNKKAAQSGIALPPDVSLFLAENTASNIRELEGFLLRIAAFASIKKTTKISMDLVNDALRNFLDQKRKIITVEDIKRKVASKYNIKVSDIKSKKKNKTFILPRHIAMYLTRQLTDLSLPEIGRSFGGRDHTTIIHAINKVEKMLSDSPEFADNVNRLTKEIENGNHH